MLDNPSWTVLTGWQLIREYGQFLAYVMLLTVVVLGWPRSFGRAG